MIAVSSAARFRLPLVMASAILVFLAGCRRERDTSPPQIAYGQQECDHCRMIISEERFAAALVTNYTDGARKLAFDDVGCLLDWMSAHHGQQAGDVPYVHDFTTKAWLDARNAAYVRCDKLQSPMASNLAAFSGVAGAEEIQSRFPGAVLNYTQISAPTATPRAAAGEGSKP